MAIQENEREPRKKKRGEQRTRERYIHEQKEIKSERERRKVAITIRENGLR